MLIIGLEYLGHIRPTSKRPILVRRIGQTITWRPTREGYPLLRIGCKLLSQTTCAMKSASQFSDQSEQSARYICGIRKPRRAFPLDRSHELEGFGC